MFRYFTLFAAILAVLGMIGCSQLPTSGNSGISGYVEYGPIYPHVIPGEQNYLPLPGARIEISDNNGTLLQTVTTDKDGMYSTDLTPGVYSVKALEPNPDPIYVRVPEKNNPRTVAVIDGSMAKADFTYGTYLK